MAATLSFSAQALRAAAEFASREITRYCLQGVLVERQADGSILLVATDGHRMVVVRPNCEPAAEPWQSFILPGRAIKEARIGKRAITVALELADDGRITIRVDNGPSRVDTAPLDGTFPDWRSVIRDIPLGHASGNCVPPSFDPTHLGSFASLGECMAISIADHTAPALLRFPANGDGFEALGILMPWGNGIGEDVETLPDWLGIEPQAKARAKAKTA